MKESGARQPLWQTVLSWWRTIGRLGKRTKDIEIGATVLLHNTAGSEREDASSDAEEQPPAVRADLPTTQADSHLTATRRRQWLVKGSLTTGALIFAVGFFVAGFATRAMLESDSSPAASSSSGSSEADQIAAQLFPDEGVTLDVRWGDVMPRLVEQGVIDIDKFKAAASRRGLTLTPEQLRILTEGSDERLTISADTAYFMVNTLWALGIANSNPILEQGPMAERGWEQRGNYASTGGWTLGKQPGGEYVSAFPIISLTPEQQAIVAEVAYNSYRPCCGNPTAFPDCNHGAAALGLAELMASQGASADDIFEAIKTFNTFWFPQQYYTLAVYFDRQGQSWSDVDPRVLLGRQHSSASGFKQVRNQLQGQIPSLSGSGGSCGA